ncbi:FAD-binding oxidoreductase [Brevibacillus borstelensis]|uniref:FAD-binding oxidoreductase n=1 Tax=Brevibacillus borstelensis TaxID=45462 RepID=UPI0030C0AB34
MSVVDDLLKVTNESASITTNENIREHHSKDLTSYHEGVSPDVVVFPTSKEDVSNIVAYAYQNEIPIVPFGMGTSVEGQVIPVKRGICLDFTRMNQIVELRLDDMIVKVQPGVTRMQLNKYLKKYGLFFPVDPGADATLGGMAATNASGCSAVRYGTMKDQILGLEVVLADGSIIRTGSLAKKSSAGYNLTQLFVGSEGTLGVFTELTLKLQGIPESTLFVKAVFPHLSAAGNAARAIIMNSIPVGKLELVDEQTIVAINKFKQTDFLVLPTLFVELSGSKKSVENDLEIVKELINEEGCLEWDFSFETGKNQSIWQARHDAALAIAAMAPGKRLMTTDVCVPITSLPEAVVHARGMMEKEGVDGAILGHLGDGNYHAVLIVDPNSSKDIEIAHKVNEEIVRFALSKNGTCTGEHGIGLGKAKYLPLEHGQAVDVMKAIKNVLDQKGILNPGKIFL